jgi:tRNA(Ile)-lysidine synthase TilS/MesJ
LTNITAQLLPIAKKRVIVACSGGPDSMVLLEMLHNFYGTEFGKYVIVAHIHH